MRNELNFKSICTFLNLYVQKLYNYKKITEVSIVSNRFAISCHFSLNLSTAFP